MVSLLPQYILFLNFLCFDPPFPLSCKYLLAPGFNSWPSSLLYLHSSAHCGFKFYLCIDDSHIVIVNLSLEFQTYISNHLPEASTLTSDRYVKQSMFKMEILTFPPISSRNRLLPQVSPSQWAVARFSNCLGPQPRNRPSRLFMTPLAQKGPPSSLLNYMLLKRADG